MIELTDDEKWLIQQIIESCGEDYDVWPRIDWSLMPTLNSLDDRGIISIMGNGDIQIVDKDAEAQVRNEMESEDHAAR